ncbi:HNH/ENDO VII family nuclease [Bacillus thuringiensis]|uniref:HNH/ENDO VII family nuclease n=1 Tax=Bacillus thuringiensis TaxID=1428 RepID=UPI001F0A9555|nr:HNH/ENDO VII family nuclease [Bacillus thuringiensis]
MYLLWHVGLVQNGAKSKEVRKWMLDSVNYELDHFSLNRSAGAKLGERYLPPTKK